LIDPESLPANLENQHKNSKHFSKFAKNCQQHSEIHNLN
jgi:hypothetical protein